MVQKIFACAYARVSCTNSTTFQPPHVTKPSYGPAFEDNVSGSGEEISSTIEPSASNTDES